MIDFIKRNKQFLLMLLIWIGAGAIFTESDLLLIPIGFILLKRKSRFIEIIIAFMMLLFLSDNRHHVFDFARQNKEVIIVLLSMFVFFDSRQFKDRSQLYLPFIVFILFAFVLSANNPDPINSFEKVFSFSLLFIAIPNYFIKELNEDGESFLRDFIWFCVTLLFIGLLTAPFLGRLVWTSGRFNGVLGNPNGVGIYSTLFVILITVARHHFPNLFSKKEYLFIIFVIAASVLLSSSRNCIFSILIFVFFRRFYKISYLYGFIIVIVSVIVFQFINDNLTNIITSLGLGSYLRVSHLDDGSGRFVAWAFAWKEIQHSFYFGRGFGFEKYYFDLNKDYLSKLGHMGGVHSSYLAMWMNTGLIGLILYMTAFIRTFIKAARVNYLAIPAMFTILFSITFESWVESSLNPFNITFLLIITLLQFVKNETPTEESTISVR